MQAIQQVQVVFACLAELCGRTEGLAAALGELLPRLEAAQLNAPAQAASADTAGSAGAASEGSQQTEGRSSSEPGAGAVEGPGAGVGVEEVRLALRRVFLQLHRRAGRFAQVLRAAAAGEQLPGACGPWVGAYNTHCRQNTDYAVLKPPRGMFECKALAISGYTVFTAAPPTAAAPAPAPQATSTRASSGCGPARSSSWEGYSSSWGLARRRRARTQGQLHATPLIHPTLARA